MSDEFHDVRVSLRLKKEYVDMIDEIIKENPDLYLNRSHVFRRGLMKTLKEHKKI